jgi:hypothetical protein
MEGTKTGKEREGKGQDPSGVNLGENLGGRIYGERLKF